MHNAKLEDVAPGSATWRPPSPRLGLRAHLLALALALVLPALGLGAVIVWQAVQVYQAGFQARLEDTARALALAINSEIGAYKSAVATLAGSATLDGPAPALAGFEREARRASDALGTSLLLLEAETMRQLVNTALPPGTPAGGISAGDFRAAATTRQPLVTDVVIGAVARRPVVGVAVPVERDGGVPFVIAARIEPARLAGLLRVPALSGAALSALVDGRGTGVARSRGHERFVGQPAAAWYRQAVAGRIAAGFLRGQSLEKEDVVVGYAPLSAAPGWTVLVAEPWAEYAASGRRPLQALAAGGAVVLGLGLLMAIWLAQRMLRPVQALAADAAAVTGVPDGTPPPAPAAPPSSITEFETLRRGLAAADAALRARTEEARAGEERMRLAVESTGMATWDLDAETGRLVWSRHHFLMLGHEPGASDAATVEMWRARVHPDDLPRIEAEWVRAEREGGLFHVTYRIQRADDGTTRWMESYGRYIRDGSGPVRFVGVMFDVTERKAAEERQRLLMREVDHRAKNALAVVQSVVRLTRAEDAKAFATAVEGRVRALARAHELLARDRWEGAGLREIVEQEVGGYRDADRVQLDGPDLRLVPEAAQPFSMVLHELATNAAKHGALSAPDGRVSVTWQVRADDGALGLRWIERGGPPLDGPPHRTGFGSRLVDTTVRNQLGGAVAFDWQRAGLVCDLTVSGDRIAGRAAPPQPAGLRARAVRSAAESSFRGLRVLVVEDEALIATDILETLRGLGCDVVGPAGTVDEALRLSATADRLDVAVLDVSLHGHASFPVADALAGRGVPVIFATGYSELPDGSGGIAAAVLRKPVAPGTLARALQEAVGSAAA